jgi:hypothetical protein
MPFPDFHHNPNLSHGPTWVPDKAGLGTAKLLVSIESWKVGKVASSPNELPVVKQQETRSGDAK